MNFCNLQKILGVAVDGKIGRGTLTALFKKLGANQSRAEELALAANIHLKEYAILYNELRFAHFIAQLAHESGNFRYMEEIASGAAYEGRKDLGNIMAGDGVRFKGRGPIQLTGRTNYQKYGRALGIDFEAYPELVAIPSIGLLVACKFWVNNGLNELADRDDLLTITRRINGGTNGLDDRKAKLTKIKSWMT
ncbi:TPA: glycoside hydrolase family 19 protein [Acinetobacter baumannii]|uniref:glycoside hydrolase family 19 protein n=1 Tax=Acinetobacter baumannii TaxID=470 RepID=UPI0003B81D50|nr:glycoside hydrolase family 19 protein [Acinetobacter baumannii]ARG33841.1 glycoside hydrolase [Acinetobacter baumannii]EHU1299995.1 glycoside hydrolase [Acinetobacter baumannii]EXA69802.1 chitinase class I family protein [Acinetobacter baumannii 984213]KAA8931358.1 glycoside hydrolase [Acinetobacter baumannii]KAA8938182.1 glycoside hydrolase [Acinetobacter baumannii]